MAQVMYGRSWIILALLLALTPLWGCSGRGLAPLARRGAAVELEVQSSTAADFGSADSITLQQSTVDGELRCEIVAAGAASLKGLFCEISFDPARLTPLQAEPTGVLGSAGETLTLAAMQRGRLLFAQARVHPEACAGYTGDGVLARVRFAWRAYDECAAAGIACRREASDAPVSTLSASQAHWEGGGNAEDWQLRWDYASQGDYDQNSEVGAPDLAPLAAHFSESVVPDKFARTTIQSVIDGDNNGELMSADMVPIAQNFGNVVEGYHIYQSANLADYPSSPAAVSSIEPLGSVLLSTAEGQPFSARLTLSFHVTDVLEQLLWVRPYQGGQEGVPSNLVNLAEQGPALSLATAAQGGIGSAADPFIIDAATDYQLRVLDPQAGDITSGHGVEYAASGDASGVTVSTDGVIIIEDSYTGDFAIAASYGAVQAQPVLHFRVPDAATPVLMLSNPPALGNGLATDPFIADTATTYQFQLVHLLHGEVSGDALTEWTVSDPAAGSIVKGNPATLDIADGYSGTFTVGATYDGAGSVPGVIYLRVPAAGTPQLWLAEPPLNGSGRDFDPYEVDNALDYVLRLEVDGTDYGADAATAWTLSDPAAGTVDASGAQAVLQIDDSYSDVFSISATYNGLASVPAALWLDGTPSSLPDPPVADLQVAPGTSTDDPLTEFTFDASASTAAVGSIDYYSWDWDGDGVWEVGETSSNILTHTFGTTGVFNATVRVTDDRGATATASVEVTVTDHGNFLPSASLMAQVQAGSEWYDALTAEVPVTVTFDASASSDPDGPIDHYRWDLDGDGVFSDLGASAQQSCGYTADGVVYAAVQAYDSAGGLDTAYVELTLTQPGGNMTPRASLQADSTFGSAPLTVNCDASLSTDPNFDVLTFAWDWDGNGVYDESTGETATATHVYNSAGDYHAVVKASDPGGLSDTAELTITVDDGTASWHFYDVAVPDGTAYTSMGAYCALAVVDGKPAIAFQAEIENTSYAPRQLMYVRATDANGTSWDAPANIHAPGNQWDEIGYAPELELVGGAPVVVYAANIYSGSQWYYRIYARTASDPQGLNWGAAQSVAGAPAEPASLHLDAAVVDGTAAVAYYFAGDRTLRYRRATDGTGTTWGGEAQIESFAFSGTPQTVDPTLAVVNGNPAVAYFYYTDGDLSIPDELHYARASDTSGTAWNSPQTLAIANGYGWSNSLLFHNGLPLLATVDNSVENHSILRCFTGSDANGAAWGTPVAVHDAAGGGWFPPLVCSAKLALVGGHPALAYFEEDMDAADLYYVRAATADGTAWQGVQQILPGADFIARELSLAEVNGHPAVAFTGAVDAGEETFTSLRYAVYY